MKILILTFYYSPDLCAGSFRATSFVNELSTLVNHKGTIDVITTMPNRYKSYDISANEKETKGNVSIKRIKLPKHKSGFVDQSKSFSKYAIEVLKFTRNQKYDLVFATSSRLFTAFLGALVAKRVYAPLYLDIRDIFTDTMKDILRGKPTKLILPLLYYIEKHTVTSAKKVNLVSRGFVSYFKAVSPDQSFSFYTNGIDEEFIGIDFNKKETTEKSIILYAGNIGEGQGLENIIPAVAAKLKDNWEFWIVGDGGRKTQLENQLALYGVKNVKLIPPVDRRALISLYKKCDYLFLHLNNYDAFKKVLPSKVFEYGAIGKPILAGVSGYAKEFTQSYVKGAIIFEPCNADDFVNKITQINETHINRDDFIKTFNRKSIMHDMANDIMTIAT